jgi:hypothetical protein
MTASNALTDGLLILFCLAIIVFGGIIGIVVGAGILSVRYFG